MIYIIEMSKGPSIKIDEEDLAHIQTNIAQALIRVKQGIINPSFMVSIIPTNEKDTYMETRAKTNESGIIIGVTKEIRTLADKMNIKNLKQLK